MKFFKHLTIKKKLWYGALIFLLFYLLSGIFSYYYSAKAISFLDPVNVNNFKNAVMFRKHLKEIIQAFSDAASTGEDYYLDLVNKKTSEFNKTLVILKKDDPAELLHYSNIQNKLDTYIVAANEVTIVFMKDEFSGQELAPLAEKVKEALFLLRKDIDELINKKHNNLLEILDHLESISKQHVSIDLFLLLFVLVICVIAAPLIIRSIIEPISDLVRVTKKLGEGELDARAKVDSDDEIGVLAQSFNFMSQSLQEKNKKLQDTTEELRKANKQLKEVDKHKSNFLASMSHELRTPLNAIINFTDQVVEDWGDMKEDEEWNEEAKDMLARVLKSSRHLLSLINDLLDLAKIESGKMELYFEDTDIIILIQDTLESVRSLADAKGLILESEIPGDIPLCRCDERKIKQVVINLLSNAIKFTDKGKVTAKVSLSDNFKEGVRIDVIDTGIGIPKESMDVIFDRFRQVDGSDSRKHQGTGLGLDLVKEIIKLHYGRTEVSSVLGKGSCFSVYVPFNADNK